ncbi:hypothetical protein GCM10027615_23010 [Plantactinospora veratri]
MLAPGESLTERIARSSRDAAGSNRPPAAGADPLDTPTGAMPGSAGRRGGPLNTPTGAMPGTGGRGGTVHTARGGGVGRGLAGARQAGDSVVRTVQGWPRKMQLAVAGGVAAVLLVSIVALSLGGGDDPADTPTPQAGPTSEAPVPASFATQSHSAKGVSVNVPKGWKKSGAGVYTDYTDPEDSGRRVRILVESGRTPMGFMKVAEGGLKKNGSSCKKPYTQVALQEVEVAGKPAAELEYTCGEGSGKRHGVWRAITEDGKAYSFYLTTPDARFEESKPIFDEMVKSFRLGSAG